MAKKARKTGRKTAASKGAKKRTKDPFPHGNRMLGRRSEDAKKKKESQNPVPAGNRFS
jgi:hypothetical protein